jgi:hypothetical protein
VEAFNAGYEHWTSQHSLINYLGRVQDFNPDYVVVMHAVTDLVYGYYNPKTSRHPFDRAYGHNYGPLAFLVKSRYVPGARISVWDHSRLFWYLRRDLRFAIYGEARRGVDDLRVYPKDTQPPGKYPSLWCYERNIDTLKTLLSIQGPQLVLMTHPTNLPALETAGDAIRARFGELYEFRGDRPVRTADFVEGLKAFNGATRKMARDMNVPLVDLDAKITGRGDLFADPWTLNAAGCEEAARHIADVLLPLIPQQPPAAASGT